MTGTRLPMSGRIRKKTCKTKVGIFYRKIRINLVVVGYITRLFRTLSSPAFFKGRSPELSKIFAFQSSARLYCNLREYYFSSEEVPIISDRPVRGPESVVDSDFLRT